MKIETLKPVRLDGNDVPAGEVIEIEDVLAQVWIEKGLAKIPGISDPAEPEEMEESKEQTEPIEGDPDGSETDHSADAGAGNGSGGKKRTKA